MSPPRPVAVVPVGDAAITACLILTQELRRAGIAAEMGYRGRVGARLKRADRLGARYAILIGDEELAKGAAQLRDLDSGDQREVPRRELLARLGSEAPATA